VSRDYRKLRVFSSADELAFEIYKITMQFPHSEQYGITSQLRGTALSVPTNIVEGSQRSTVNDYLHFRDMAFGSLAETGYLIEFAFKLGYIDNISKAHIIQKHENCIKQLKALIKFHRPQNHKPKT